MSELAVAVRRVVAAQHPEDLFEVEEGAAPAAKAEQLKRSFRRLARVVHPDANGNAPGSAAAFQKLELLYAQAQAALRYGQYGDRVAVPPLVRLGKAGFELGEKRGTGDVADLFHAYAGAGEHVLKIARDAGDNDLLENEAQALRLLQAPDAQEARLQPYVPRLTETFLKETTRVNALPFLDGFVSLREIRRAYPDGIHWRDMAWMFRRLLVAAGFAHVNGLVHGAVVPEHALVHPTGHGLVLVDWCYHVPAGGTISAVPRRYRSWMPPEVLAKEPADSSTDIFMAVRCAQFLLGADAPAWRVPGSVPKKLRSFLSGCALTRRSERPADAWELLADFDELIGPREYRPFLMPSSSGPSAAPTDERGDHDG